MVTASFFCPCVGGCTTVVVVVPFLSTETTCCGWPVAGSLLLGLIQRLLLLGGASGKEGHSQCQEQYRQAAVRINELELNMVHPLSRALYPNTTHSLN